MEALSNADRFVILLRQKLAERAQLKTGSAKRTAPAKGPADSAPPAPISEAAARAGADQATLGRTIVEQLLTEQFGTQLANEAKFQQVVDQVAVIISNDAQLGEMLQQIMQEIRG